MAKGADDKAQGAFSSGRIAGYPDLPVTSGADACYTKLKQAQKRSKSETPGEVTCLQQGNQKKAQADLKGGLPVPAVGERDEAPPHSEMGRSLSNAAF